MILTDVNVLVYAQRRNAPDHIEYRRWLETIINGEEPYGVSDLILSGFLRIVTHPGIFRPPTAMKTALQFADQFRGGANAVRIEPGPRHWGIFTRLCASAGAKGYLVPDAYLAALAIESGCEWVTTDRDYSRFPGLSWRLPIQSE